MHPSVPGGEREGEGSSSESTKHRRAWSHRGFATSWRVTSRRRARPGLGSGHGASGMAPAGGTGAPPGLASWVRHKAWEGSCKHPVPCLATKGRWEPSPGEHQPSPARAGAGFSSPCCPRCSCNSPRSVESSWHQEPGVVPGSLPTTKAPGYQREGMGRSWGGGEVQLGLVSLMGQGWGRDGAGLGHLCAAPGEGG